jgi:antitoxin component of RelBE/YafQ-DinJ toxin-antitoxin module
MKVEDVINMTFDQIVRHHRLPVDIANYDQKTIHLRKLKAEIAKGTDAARQGMTKGIDEVRAMFTDSDKN